MLKIGDSAPAIKVQTWVRGQPVTQFEKGKVYVLDFWATWCGGCIISFPHISGIAAKYQDRVSFSSIDTYEQIDGIKKAPLVKVTEFLKTPAGQALKLNIAVDGPANTMWNTWIQPLRRNGLPTTYVIDQDGKVAWVDVNLDHLEWVLDEVLAKRWDRARAATIMEKKDAIETRLFSNFKAKGAEATKSYQAVLAESEAFEKQFPDRKDAVAFFKFMALMELDKSKLPGILEQMAADPRSRYLNLSDVAGLSLQRTDLSTSTYAAVAKVMERCIQNEYPAVNTCGKTVADYSRLASAYERSGDPANAAASMEKALALTGSEKTPAKEIQKLEQAVSKYKAAAVHKTGS